MVLNKIFFAGLLYAAIAFPNAALENLKGANVKTNVKWAIEKSSTLKVFGKSNVNKFSCQIDGYAESDTITISGSESGGAVRLNGTLAVDVLDFDCNSKLITSDFRKTLKAKEYPGLRIKFLSLDRAPFLDNKNQCINGWVEVELAGVKKLMKVPFTFSKENNAMILMNGKKQFCLSDFELTPPKKLAGMVKIVDEFTVDFRLKLIAIK